MAIMSDGFNTYIRRNGEWVPVIPENAELSVNGQPIYRFVKATGVLELSMPPSDLEKMASEHGVLPAEGIAVKIDMPPFGTQHFEGVKSFKPLPDKDGKYFFPSEDPVKVPALQNNAVSKSTECEMCEAGIATKPSVYQRFKAYVRNLF